MPQTLIHHRFSVDDYEQMIEHGILNENDRVELIRGEVVAKMPIGDLHSGSVNRANHLFNVKAANRAVVSIQNPVRLPDSEPEPDLTLLKPRADFYATGKPRPVDVLLLMEVADTTLDFDREVKGPLYAQAGIQEYWILNLCDNCLEVHRQPQTDGRYAEVRVLRPGQQIEIAAMAGIVVKVDELL